MVFLQDVVCHQHRYIVALIYTDIYFHWLSSYHFEKLSPCCNHAAEFHRDQSLNIIALFQGKTYLVYSIEYSACIDRWLNQELFLVVSRQVNRLEDEWLNQRRVPRKLNVWFVVLFKQH